MFAMHHVEVFDCKIDASEFEEFMRNKLLPYWRSRGFEVQVYRAEAGLGPAQYALVTAMDNFASIDSWPERATGDERGRDLMAQYLSYVYNLRAAVVKDIEA